MLYAFCTRVIDIPALRGEMNGDRQSVQRFKFRPVILAAPTYKIEGRIAAAD